MAKAKWRSNGGPRRERVKTGWLTLYPICIVKGLEVKFESDSVVVYYISTTWISTKPGLYTRLLI